METVHSQYWVIVEDDDNDFLLFQRACRRAVPCSPRLQRFSNGLAAKAYLSDDPPLPSLIVSDIKMPGIDGFELLQWVKDQRDLAWVPFVVLSNSNSTADVARARQLKAADYQVKPADSRSLATMVETLLDLSTAQAGG